MTNKKAKVSKAKILFYLVLAISGGGNLTFSVIDFIRGDKCWGVAQLLIGLFVIGGAIFYFLEVEVLEDKEAVDE